MALSSLPLPRRRRGACPAGNPATVKADLDDVLAHNAKLAAELLAARRDRDRAESRAEAAHRELVDFREEMREAHAKSRRSEAQLKKDIAGLRSQLDDALGYGGAEKAAIASGKGEPLRRGA